MQKWTKGTPDLVILTSGGYDSAVLLVLAKQLGFHPMSLLIDYGQKHVKELDAAEKICGNHAVSFHRMKVALGVNSALTGVNIGGAYKGVSEWHVPGRNTIFVGLAASLAEEIGARKIWYGANYEDRIAEFPDCAQEWIHAMNKSLAIAGSFPIELEAPLLGMRKDTILRWGKTLGLKKEELHSGYAE